MVIAIGVHHNSCESHLWWIRTRSNGLTGSSVTRMAWEQRVTELTSICELPWISQKEKLTGPDGPIINLGNTGEAKRHPG